MKLWETHCSTEHLYCKNIRPVKGLWSGVEWVARGASVTAQKWKTSESQTVWLTGAYAGRHGPLPAVNTPKIVTAIPRRSVR